MSNDASHSQNQVKAWHRNILIAAAITSVLLIAMGGILNVTQSIRSCPDWPGCFGKVLPPLETSPVLEITHRTLAALTGLLILSAAIIGLVRTRKLPWVLVPPLVSCLLVVEVSFFGAMVVLYGLAPGWAALDIGSALMVVALIITSAIFASESKVHPNLPGRLAFKSRYARLLLATAILIYGVFVSGVLVSAPNSFTSALGWPVYSASVFRADGHGGWSLLRLGASALALVTLGMVLVQSMHSPGHSRLISRTAFWLFVTAVLEAVLQVSMLAVGFKVSLLVGYTVSAAFFWGLLVTLLVRVGQEEASNL